VSMSRPWQC